MNLFLIVMLIVILTPTLLFIYYKGKDLWQDEVNRVKAEGAFYKKLQEFRKNRKK